MTKPFDEDAAKAGAPVQTRDGCKVRILCYDRKNTPYSIIALIEDHDGTETVVGYTTTGSASAMWIETAVDLVMAPVKKEGWINLSPCKNPMVGGSVHATEEEAKAAAAPHVIQVRIEWEE